MRRKIFKKVTSIIMIFAMIISMISPAYKAQASTDNVALNKKVTASGVEGGYLEDGSLKYPQFTPENLTDGNASTRWSSDNSLRSLDLSTNPEQNVWACIDLEEEIPIGKIQLKWANANSRDYDIQVSSDGEEWKVLKNYQDPDNVGKDYTEILELTQPEKARYVRIYARLGTCLSDGYQCPTIALYEIEVYKAQVSTDNMALNKKVTASGVEGGYLEDGSLKYPQFIPENLTDGNASTRWSSDNSLRSLDLTTNPEQNVWACIDLEEEILIEKIQLKWANANSRDYDIQVSSDGEEWKVLKNYQDPDNVGKDYTEILELTQPEKARYVRIYARLGTCLADGYQCPTIALYEIEVYQYQYQYEDVDIESVLETALAADVMANEDYTQLIFPEVPEGFSLHLYSSSNLAVVDLEGNIIRPLEDMNVNLFYEVSMADGTSLKSDEPKKVTIEGLYDESESINEKPSIVPEIREWKGNEGYVVFNDTIVIESEELRETAEQIAMYLKEMSDIDAMITTGTPNDGNIYLEIDENSILGDEGYGMEISDIVTVTAKNIEGILYGGTTISQILSQAEDHHSMPKGLMRDYPQYEIRAVMLDVARIYIPLDYLQEMTRYAGYFKISEFRNHINDNGGEQPASFRVESKVYPQLNAGLDADHVYSQEDYIAYQKDAKKYGVDVVTEIDSPAHAGAFGKIDGSLTMDGNHLDLRTEEAYQKSVSVMKKTYDEFLDGEDPVFQNGKFHIGSDEYNKDYSEVLRRYIDEMIQYVNAKGYETRFWASLGTNGFAGETPVSTDAIAHLWATSWASFDEMKADGYSFINNADDLLYVVPFADYYHNYLDIKKLYDTWEYANLDGGLYLAAGHPQLLGAEAAIWYDYKVGASEFDIFDRFRDQIMLMAEKGWYGDRDDETGSEFIQRVEAVGKKAPKANPARYIESASSLIAAYDFEQVENGVAADTGNNGYDTTLNELNTENGVLLLDGEGYLELPFASVGYPYTVQFDLTIDENTPENALLFEGKDGKLFYNYDGTGKLGYERKGYSYLIDMRIPVGINTKFTIVCDATDTTLYINKTEAGSGQYYKVSAVTSKDMQASSTFVLPTEKIGSGICGTMDNLKLFNYTMSSSEISGVGVTDESDNVALNKTVTVSGVEGGYLEDGSLKYPQFDPMYATDGDTGTRISLNRSDDAWVTVDLGDTYLLEKILIRFNQLPNAYSVLVSNDGSEWREIDRRTDLNGGSSSVDEIAFETMVGARYIKYQQLEMFPAYGSAYSGNFSEFEVYGFDTSIARNILTDAQEAIDACEVTAENEAFIGLLSENIEKLEAVLTTGPVREISLLTGTVKQQLELLASGEIPQAVADKGELEKLLNENLSESEYLESGWNDYAQALKYAEGVYYDVSVDQETVNYACAWINEAKAMLVYRVERADYGKVKEAIAEANALVKENYKDFSAVDAAVAAVVEGLDYTKQAEVDAFAQAITDAIAALEHKTYIVIFRTGDGFSNQMVAEITHKAGDTLTVPESKTYLHYIFTGWDGDGDGKVDVTVGESISDITEDKTYVAVYENDPACWFRVSFTDGSQGSIASASTAADTEGKYLVNTQIKVTAPATSGEQKFAGWYKGEELVSVNTTYSFYLKGDVELKAVYAEKEPEAVPAVTFSTLQRIDGYSTNPRKDRASFGITWDAPSGCTVMKEGILRVYANSGEASDLILNSQNTNVKNQVCSKVGRAGSYTVNCTIGATLEGEDLYVRGYLTYRDSAGTVKTVYTEPATLKAE